MLSSFSPLTRIREKLEPVVNTSDWQNVKSPQFASLQSSWTSLMAIRNHAIRKLNYRLPSVYLSLPWKFTINERAPIIDRRQPVLWQEVLVAICNKTFWLVANCHRTVHYGGALEAFKLWRLCVALCQLVSRYSLSDFLHLFSEIRLCMKWS